MRRYTARTIAIAIAIAIALAITLTVAREGPCRGDQQRHIFRTQHRQMHTHGHRRRAGCLQSAAQTGQAFQAAPRGIVHRLRQGRGQGRRIQGAAHYAQQRSAAEHRGLRLATQRVEYRDAARQTLQELLPVAAQAGKSLLASGLCRAIGPERIERSLAVQGRAGR